MFGSVNDMVLKLRGQKVKLLTEAGNAHGEIPMLFRMFFCINQGVSINCIKLHVTKPAFTACN